MPSVVQRASGMPSSIVGRPVLITGASGGVGPFAVQLAHPSGARVVASVSRAAQLAFTKVLSQEGAPYNVLANSLHVGVIVSDQIVRRHQREGTNVSLEEFIRLLPEGIGVIPLFLDIRRGTVDEFAAVLDDVEAKVSRLAGIGVDLIHPEGAPPFMTLGVRGEAERVAEWERRYGVPIVTASQTQIEAMRALGMRRIVGITYFTGDINDLFARYFAEAGFDVLAMSGVAVRESE